MFASAVGNDILDAGSSRGRPMEPGAGGFSQGGVPDCFSLPNVLNVSVYFSAGLSVFRSGNGVCALRTAVTGAAQRSIVQLTGGLVALVPLLVVLGGRCTRLQPFSATAIFSELQQNDLLSVHPVLRW
jgi:high-affinity Fe2+/Pb2+ permease